MPEVCLLIQEWQSSEIRIGRKTIIIGQNGQGGIIKEISHIHFPNLRLIALWRNNIRSIEDLCRVDFPSIEWINLGS